MTRYIYGGLPGYKGRFGFLKTGDQVDLTDQEAAAVAGVAQWAKVPSVLYVPRFWQLIPTGIVDLPLTVNGKQLLLQRSSNVTFAVNLPFAGIGDVTWAHAGWNVVMRFDESSLDQSPIDVAVDSDGLIDDVQLTQINFGETWIFYSDGVQYRKRKFAE